MVRRIKWNDRSYDPKQFQEMLSKAPKEVAEKMQSAHDLWQEVAKTRNLDKAKEWSQVVNSLPGDTFQEFLTSLPIQQFIKTMNWKDKEEPIKALFSQWQETDAVDQKILRFDKGRSQLYWKLGQQAEIVKKSMTQHGEWLILLQFLGLAVATVNHARRLYHKWSKYEDLAGKTLSEADLGPTPEKKELNPLEKAKIEAKAQFRSKFADALLRVNEHIPDAFKEKVKALMDDIGEYMLIRSVSALVFDGLLQIKLKGTAEVSLEPTK